MTIEQNALAYAITLPPSETGKGGHDAAFRVASALVWGFDLNHSAALSVMQDWNQQRAAPPWSEHDLNHKLDSARNAPSRRGRGYLLNQDKAAKSVCNDVAPQPRGKDRPRIPSYDFEKAGRYAAGCRVNVTLDRLAELSPVPVPAASDQSNDTAEQFLSTLYAPGERVLVFTDFRSQGDFLWKPDAGGSRLGRQRNVDAVPSRLPSGGANGVWFLIQPVTGNWTIQPGHDGARYGRRHGACVTSWRYLLLESDDAPESIWLRCLVQLPLRIVALYTSGGRSVHALVRIDALSKSDYDESRNVLRSVLPILGADPAATTGVRLSRLPGCRRGNQLQRLVWLDPEPENGVPIIDRFCL